MDTIYRSTCRTQVTKLCNAVIDYFKSMEEGENPGAKLIDDLSVLLERLKVAHKNLSSANITVQTSIKPELYQSECDAIIEYEDKAVTHIAQLERAILKEETKIARSKPSTPNSNSFVSVSQPAKLEKLQLKKFDGDFNKWLPFWQQFKTAVHENPTLDGTAKFNYLQAQLVGRAAETIAGFVPSQECYSDAVKLLEEEYGSKSRITDQYIEKLMALEAVESENDVKGLRHLFNTITSVMRSLESLGVEIAHYHVMLKPLILRCLPTSLQKGFHRWRNDTNGVNKVNIMRKESTERDDSSVLSISSTNERNETQVELLLSYIKQELDALECSLSNTREKLHIKVHKHKAHAVPATATSLLTSKADSTCLFCNSSNHPSKECSDNKYTLTERKIIVKRKGKCLRCLRSNHFSKQCKDRNIKCKQCNGRHATVMCDPSYTPKNQSVSLTSTTTTTIFLQTACAYIKSPINGKELFVRLIIDDGSMRSFIKKSVADQLNLPALKTEKVSIIPFGCPALPAKNDSKVVKLLLRSQYGGTCIEMQLNTVDHICIDVLPVPNAKNVKLVGYELADDRRVNEKPVDGISVLVGADTYWTIVDGNVERITDKLSAISTKLGWTIHGPGDLEMCRSRLSNVAVNLNCCELNESVLKLWQLESIGILDHNEQSSEKFADSYIESSVSWNSKTNRYSAKLPWKVAQCDLADNYSRALSQVKTLTRKLVKDTNKFTEYDRAVREYIKRGMAVPVYEAKASNKVYYMPHQPVYRQDKTTTKVRVVFNASSHLPGCKSLNEFLHTGTNLLPNLLKIRLNFRLGRIAMVADIEKAFLMIELDEEDRDSHRFIWYAKEVDDITSLPPLRKFKMVRLTFGVKSSPFILNAVIRKHICKKSLEYQVTCRRLKRGLYVDDFVDSVDTTEEALKNYKETRVIMKEASMNLRKWQTNDSFLRSVFHQEGASTGSALVQKILGINWCCVTDEIWVDLSSLKTFTKSDVEMTKRRVLVAVQSIYDPVGMFSPLSIRIKLLMQELWKRHIDWDEKLPEELRKSWKSISKDCNRLADFSIPRWIFDGDLKLLENIELHIFCDASPSAYGAVADVRSIKQKENAYVQLFCAKARVAPIKVSNEDSLTVPKLELTAAVIASRLKKFICSVIEIDFKAIYLWSDSKITLCWIKGDPARWKPFIQNRVREIRDLTNGAIWRHCSGKSNPADLITKISGIKKMIETKQWINGPEWLFKTEEEWPKEDREYEFNLDLLSLQVAQSSLILSESIFDIEEYSNLQKVLRITAYVMRFVRLRRPIEIKTHLSPEEIEDAKLYWIKQAQYNDYISEVNCLNEKLPLDKGSKLIRFDPFLDDNCVLRLNSRLLEMDLVERQPIILPKCYFVKLLIEDAHRKLFHAGVNAVLSKLRESYWIMKGRQFIRQIIKKCVVCQWLHKRCLDQPFASLTRDRLRQTKPFEVTGLDFAGPLYVKDPKDETQSIKVYLLLLTCASVRAIHLEVVTDISTESFIRAFRRFISRRGLPSIIYSDNAKTFKRAEMELNQLFKAIDTREWRKYASQENLKWKFIPERAPWWGGWWERLIRIVKDSLKSSIGKARLNLQDLQTTVTEIEYIINSRPLTYMTDDPSDLSPLTPFHFLAGYSVGYLPPTDASSKRQILCVWSERQKTTQLFWRRWSTDYMQQLRSAHTKPPKPSCEINVGDVVITGERNIPRLQWKLALVSRLFVGRDDKTRAVEVKTASGNYLRRPIQHICPLEIKD